MHGSGPKRKPKSIPSYSYDCADSDGEISRDSLGKHHLGYIPFNVFGLPTYPGVYDKFLIIVGLVINILCLVRMEVGGLELSHISRRIHNKA